MNASRSFFAGMFKASLPLWLWAAHFSFSYGAVALGCQAGWQHGTAGSWSPLQWTLALASALAFMGTAVSLLHACRQAAATDTLVARVQATAALMALLGIAWTSLPVMLLPACHLT